MTAVDTGFWLGACLGSPLERVHVTHPAWTPSMVAGCPWRTLGGPLLTRPWEPVASLLLLSVG